MRAVLLAFVLAAAGTALGAVPAGTSGPDRIDSVNGSRDTIRCGGGRDIVVADQKDVVSSDCEVLTRRIGLDTTTTSGAQHRAVVEPSAAGDGNTVVAVFQSGRYLDGGAAAIGWATSVDGGLTWQRGVLVDAGTERVSDPVVVHDGVRGVWLAAVLSVLEAETRILIYRSTNGIAWSEPIVAASGVPPPRASIGLDKEWLACDNRPLSPRRGACYLAYTDVAAGRIGVRSSADAGATWGAAVTTGPQGGEGPVGAIPTVAPDGTLVVVYATTDLGALEAVYSVDGGTTFAPPVRIATVATRSVLLRAPPLPSVTETRSGVLAVWPDCSAHPACTSNDIAISESSDGKTWGAPRVMAQGGDYVTPTIGAFGDAVAVLSYVRIDPFCCRLGIRLFRSSDGGVTWAPPTRLDARPMQIPWLARSATQGGTVGFLGDYEAVAFSGTRAVPVFTAALSPGVGSTRQDLYATTRLP